MRQIAIIAALICLSTPAVAAEFAIVNGLDGRPAVRMWGDVDPNDHLKFSAFARSHPQVFSIILSGEGGALIPAIKIGTFAHDLGLQTVVADGQDCASACAYIWLGGAKRTLEPGAKVGFHGVFTMVDGRPQPSSDGNALLGGYLVRVGYTDPAIVYMTQSPPNQMTWMDPFFAREFGITYDVQQPSKAAQAHPPTPVE